MDKTPLNINASEIAKYYLYKSLQDGELISPLKMQKLVYYGYVWTLIRNKKKLFNENIEAWPSGPVVPSLYRDLKSYGFAPIDTRFFEIKEEKDLLKSFEKLPTEIRETLDAVYDAYMTKTAFELVALTHSEKPWIEARNGLAPTEASHNPISDKVILEQYGKKR